MLSWADDPIESREEDALGRNPFAVTVAKALLAEGAKRSNVVAISGPWGSGKTSFAKLVEREIADQATIVWFEPWMVSTPDALAKEFFKALGKAIFPAKDDKESKEARTRYYKYAAQALEALSMTSDALHTFDVPLTGLISKGLKGGKKALEVAARGLEAQSHSDTLQEAKKDLSEELREHKVPIVFMVDDIDRLTVEETRTVFQVLKACADFPNIRYLLLFDRMQVVKALNQFAVDGEAFLEKIVPRIFDLPEATSEQLGRLIKGGLRDLGFGDLPRAAKDRLYQVESHLLQPGLTTIRQVKRYFGTVAALLPGMTEQGNLNIDPADFLALEFIRQNAPKLYNYIRVENAPRPGGWIQFYLDKDKYRAEVKARYDSAFEGREPIDALCREAMRILEYKVHILDTDTQTRWSPPEFVEKRFSSTYWKPLYLGFDTARVPMPESDWREFKKGLATVETAIAWLQLLSTRQDPSGWVYAIANRTALLSEGEAVTLLTALFVWGETQPMHGPLWEVGIEWDSVVSQVGQSVASQFQFNSSWNLTLALETAVKASGSVVAAASLIGPEYARSVANDFPTWSGVGGVRPIGDELKKKLGPMFTTGNPWGLPDAEPAIHAWRYLSGEKVSEAWFDDQKATREKLAPMLNQFYGRMRNEENPPAWRFRPDDDFVIAVQEVPDSLLDMNGRWAKEHIQISVDPTYEEFGRSRFADVEADNGGEPDGNQGDEDGL